MSGTKKLLPGLDSLVLSTLFPSCRTSTFAAPRLTSCTRRVSFSTSSLICLPVRICVRVSGYVVCAAISLSTLSRDLDAAFILLWRPAHSVSRAR